MKNLLSNIKEVVTGNKKTILSVTGMVCVGLTALTTVKAVKKIKTAMDEHKETTDVIEQAASLNHPDYTEDDKTNDTVINNTKTTVKIVSAVLLPAILLATTAFVTLNIKNLAQSEHIGTVTSLTPYQDDLVYEIHEELEV